MCVCMWGGGGGHKHTQGVQWLLLAYYFVLLLAEPGTDLGIPPHTVSATSSVLIPNILDCIQGIMQEEIVTKKNWQYETRDI